jgi:hypothetical protein
MTPIRTRAAGILNAIPVPIRSVDPGGKYAQYTGGLTHQTLANNWKSGGIMTGCNAFAGWYAQQLGSTKYLGRFDLATYLPSIGKGHAWVKSVAGKRPQFGDILIHTGLHEDVALAFDGDVLNCMAAGQGGKGMGFDLLCKVRGKAAYSPAKLQGWVDIDLYFGASPAPAPSANWLQGWWSVWDGSQYYYFFDGAGGVQYTKTKPVGRTAPLAHALNRGGYQFLQHGVLVIEWAPAADGVTRETFTNALLGSTKMNGTSNRYGPLVATKLP